MRSTLRREEKNGKYNKSWKVARCRGPSARQGLAKTSTGRHVGAAIPALGARAGQSGQMWVPHVPSVRRCPGRFLNYVRTSFVSFKAFMVALRNSGNLEVAKEINSFFFLLILILIISRRLEILFSFSSRVKIAKSSMRTE